MNLLHVIAKLLDKGILAQNSCKIKCLVNFERDREYAYLLIFFLFSFVEFSYLTSDVFFSKQVLSFIVEDNMHFLGTRSTDIRAYRRAREHSK